jgi:hypothetical protein
MGRKTAAHFFALLRLMAFDSPLARLFKDGQERTLP